MSKRNLLLTWHSKNHSVEVLSSTLQLLKKEKIIIKKLIYLYQENIDLSDFIGLEKLSLHIPLKNPTNYNEILKKIEDKVLPILENEKFDKLHINVSPGTPAMQVVWLLLYSWGMLPESLQLWSSQKPRDQKPFINKVEIPGDTYLHRIKSESQSN